MLKDQISTDLKEAMKSQNEVVLSTLRMLSAAFNNMEIEKRGAGAEAEDKDYQTILKREVKKRHEAIEAYKTAGRIESMEKEQVELELLSKYLPPEMSEEEVKKIVEEVIAEKGSDNMGIIIGEVVKRSDGHADGGLVSKLVRERLS